VAKDLTVPIVGAVSYSSQSAAATTRFDVEIVAEAPKQRRQCDPIGKKLKSFQSVKYYEMEEQSMLYGVPTFEKYQVCVDNIDSVDETLNFTTATFFCWRCNVEAENGKMIAHSLDWLAQFSSALLMGSIALVIACWFVLMAYRRRTKRQRARTNPDLREYTIAPPGKSWQERDLLMA